MSLDVPSPIDLCDPADAAEWERTAMAIRPVRVRYFERFAEQLASLDGARRRVLELGSGPGFLAAYLLEAVPGLTYTMLDFSAAMHALARDRLGRRAAEVAQIERSFKAPGFGEGLGQFDAVVTLQAVHELRHKRHHAALHAEVRGLLAPGGLYLVCDHFLGEGGQKNDQLYMTVEEQHASLREAGFGEVRELLREGGLVLHRASP